MSAYYNENDPFAAAWLRELIARNLIAQGDVDERSIVDVTANDLTGYTQCHFFAGIGGWSHALRLAGVPDDYPVWTGSCPCPSFSTAGKGLGFADPRHLWPNFFNLIRECRPPVVVGEQVEAAIAYGWLDLVSADLESEGYAVGQACLTAAGCGAPHKRSRLYWAGILADSNDQRRGGKEPHEGQETPVQPELGRSSFWSDCEWLPCRDGKHRPVEPGTFPLVDGIPRRVELLKGYGNAIVPQVAAEFIASYMETSVCN
jgi:DNA (cytosine-5)-methyltransferase 1